MDLHLDSVAGLVTALVSSYDAGLEYYTKWQRTQWQENHYRSHAKGKLSGSGACALSTSLAVSGLRIRETFDGGADILGPEFSVGHEQCRQVLRANLERFGSRINILRRAMKTARGPLDLFSIIRTSETVRMSSMAALSEQYQRVAVHRLVPQSHPNVTVQHEQQEPKCIDSEKRPSEKQHMQDTPRSGIQYDDDAQTAYHTAYSRKSPFQSEPPSPPPTPKTIPDDVQSTYTITSVSTVFGPRPKASVFSIFCPEAMKFQVNLDKTIPRYNKKCKCGYKWDGGKMQDKLATMLKDGFQLTPRFLAKSHCTSGFGCVLCTSSGKTEVFESVQSLGHHINTSHSKWQMLHDRDLTTLGDAAKRTSRW